MAALEEVPCSVCGSEARLAATFRVVDGYRIVRCSDCGFLFVSPRPSPQDLAELYRARETNPFFSEGYEPIALEAPVLKRVLRTIQRHESGGALLEVGCGRGDLLTLASKRRFTAVGCDFFDNAPPAGSPGVAFFDGPVGNAGLADATFDIAVIRNVLEHMFDPGEELREIARALKPNGHLYVKVLNAHNGAGPFYRKYLAPPYPFAPPYHLSHFGARTLQQLLNARGFKIVEWVVERPTRARRWRKNLERSIAFTGLVAMNAVSAGRFPQMTLACVARKS